MFAQYSNRREFLKSGGLSLILLLNSCSNVSKKVNIALQNSFLPDSFKDIIPFAWEQKRINFGSNNLEKNRNIILDSDFTLINDGWISTINFSQFNEINESYFSEILDRRSKDFLNSFEVNQRNKLFPIGLVPYAIIIKNNKDLVNSARKSWNFLLSRKLTKKIIFPESPRVLISIAEKINSSDALAKLKSQAMLFDDQNILNWLINSEACVAIVPYSLCSKYLKIDPRLSIVFPKQGVPLIWYFVLSRSNLSSEILIDWIQSLERKSTVDKLSSEGWYIPFNTNYIQSKYKAEMNHTSGPSKLCWDNSWSFTQLTNAQKIKFENYWNNLLIP